MILIFLFVNTLINLSFRQSPQGSDHHCYRSCGDGDRRVCEYEFHVEWFQTLSNACFNCSNIPQDCLRHDCIAGDGFERLVQVVNRRMPGPNIEVCEGDEVSVTVHNDMSEDTTTIHWHGEHQKKTQFMDGVPFITQCPINPETSFKYRFRASAGTHFWHSHTGFQRANGIVGPLVARRNLSLERNLYDFDLSEHIILIQDWTNEEPKHLFIKWYFKSVYNKPRSLLINGLGRYINGQGDTRGVPAPRFVVNKGNRYRFRLIGSTFMDVPILFSIDQHKFKVIATDGADIRPEDADTLTIVAGERYDIVVHANQTTNLYWMRFQGLQFGRSFGAHQAAVLQYKNAHGTTYPAGVPTWIAANRKGQSINGIHMPLNNIPVDHLRSASKVNISGTPDYQLYIVYNIRTMVDPRFQLSKPSPTNDLLNLTNLPIFNNIAMKLFSFPLLSQKDQINESLYCNGDTVPPTCNTTFCSCPYIVKVNLGALVELIIVDEGLHLDAVHPIHLHGHSFHVLGMEKLGQSTTKAQIQSLDRQGQLKRNFINSPAKDTVQIPDGGYTIVRFYADNPGFWLLHCHIDIHTELGMIMVFQIGERNLMPNPPSGFPKCGEFTNSNKNSNSSNKKSHRHRSK